MDRSKIIAALTFIGALMTVAFAYADEGGYQDPQVLNHQCFVLAPGETLSLTTKGTQKSEFQDIAAALGKEAKLDVASARLETFRYSGNPTDTAILSFDLTNGLSYEGAADQTATGAQTFVIEDDGGGYTVMPASANRIVLLDTKSARIDLLATPDQLQQIQAKTSIEFEGGTGSLTVEQGQSALFVPTTCR